jgi:hypothetical protein
LLSQKPRTRTRHDERVLHIQGDFHSLAVGKGIIDRHRAYRRALSRHSSAGRFALEIAAAPSELHTALGSCEPTFSTPRVTKHVGLVKRCECEPCVIAERPEDLLRALGHLEVLHQGASLSEDVEVREEDARALLEAALVGRL